MAVTAPTLTPLPPAPLPTDAEAVFDAKAGVRLTAEEVMVVELNASFGWVATQVNAAEGYKNAAATSAGAAANSATAANASKNAAAQSAIDATNNGAAQVVLAANQVTLAVNAKNSAEVAAAAAGSAAGLPALNGAGNLLTINPANNGVAFISPLPLLHATALLF